MSDAVPDLLAIPVGKPRLFLADKGYDGDFLREELLIHRIRPVIPPRANRKNHLPATSGHTRIETASSGCSTASSSSVALRPDTKRPENPSRHSSLWQPRRYGCHTLSKGPKANLPCMILPSPPLKHAPRVRQSARTDFCVASAFGLLTNMRASVRRPTSKRATVTPFPDMRSGPATISGPLYCFSLDKCRRSSPRAQG